MPVRNAIKGKQLYRILFLGVICAVVSIGVLAVWGVREIRRDAAVVAVESSAKGISGAVTVLVNAVTRSNEEIGASGLESLNSTALRGSLSKLIRKHPVLRSIMVSDNNGLLYSLSRRPNGYLEGISVRDNAIDTTWNKVGLDGSSSPTMPEYPFNREQVDTAFKEEFAAIKPGQVHWRSTYRFHPSGERWLTASTLAESGGRTYLISYIFPVDSVANQLGGAEKGSADKVFFYWKSGKVLSIPHVSGVDVETSRASEPVVAHDVIDPVVATAAGALEVGSIGADPYALTVDGEEWWAYVMPLPIFENTISLGVVVPRRNIVSALTSDTFLQVFGGALVLFAAIILYILHRNKARIEALGLRQKAARTAEDILRLIAEGESGTLEFKQTLRYNLKAQKNGKEIEHASLKSVAGFMNSEGGTLLVGVADNGVVTGFEEDKLGNDDKALLHFNNLVNQQIGTEFARYLDTTIIEVQGKHVLRAHCIPAAAPAILKTGKTEEFYVRSGPASRQLTLSQFYEWLQNHSS